MATTVGTLNPETPLSRRIIIWIIALVGIFVFTGLLLAFNYWVAVVFFFVSLLILFRFNLNEYEMRGLWLLLIINLFVAVFVSSLALLFLSNNPRIPQLAQNSTLAGIFLGSNGAIVLTSFLIGLIVALVGVIVPFLLLVMIATSGILKWHRKDQAISFRAAYWYTMASVLGIFYPWVIIENGEIKGNEPDKGRLAHFGGPGWLTVHPGQVVVLHRWGKITRVVGLGSSILKREEQIKAIVPLNGKGGTTTIENVLTRDRIPLKITVAHAVQVEPAGETATRLPGIKSDKVGDDYDQCYESTARLVATKVLCKDNVVDIWDTMKVAIINNIKDVIMSCDFDDLFSTGEDTKDLGVCLNNRKIVEVEKTVFERVKGSGFDKGLALRVVDINEVCFPDEIKGKINEQVTAFLDAKIRQNAAKAKELTAQYEAQAARFEASGILERARAKGQAEFLEGQGRAAARAEYYKQVIQILRESGRTDNTIEHVIQNLASSTGLEDELKRLLELTVHYIQGEHTGKALPKSTGD